MEQRTIADVGMSDHPAQVWRCPPNLQQVQKKDEKCIETQSISLSNTRIEYCLKNYFNSFNSLSANNDKTSSTRRHYTCKSNYLQYWRLFSYHTFYLIFSLKKNNISVNWLHALCLNMALTQKRIALRLQNWVHKYLTWSISASQHSLQCLAQHPGGQDKKKHQTSDKYCIWLTQMSVFY